MMYVCTYGIMIYLLTVRRISASQKYKGIIEPSAISKRCDSLVKKMMEM